MPRCFESCRIWWYRWELLRSDFEGMQPTLRQVPPRVPRFSIHVTWVFQGALAIARNQDTPVLCRCVGIHLHALLASLDGSDIAGDTAADDDEIPLCTQSAPGPNASRGRNY
jgi:hypothetical protein